MTAVDEAAVAAQRPTPRQGQGTLLILVSACCFGMVATFGRLAYDGGSNPATIVLLRHLCIVLVVGGLILARRRSFTLPRHSLLATLRLGLFLLMMACGFLGAVYYIPVSLVALILYTNPLLVALLAIALRRERVTPAKTVLLLGAFAGLALALGPPFAQLNPAGLGLAFMAAVGIALAYITGGPLLRSAGVLVVNFYTNLWVVLPVAAYLLLAGGLALPTTGLGTFGAAATVAVTVAAMLTWFAALPRSSPVRMSVLFYLDAVVNILAGVFVLGESLDAVQVVGIVVVLACLVAMALRRAE